MQVQVGDHTILHGGWMNGEPVPFAESGWWSTGFLWIIAAQAGIQVHGSPGWWIPSIPQPFISVQKKVKMVYCRYILGSGILALQEFGPTDLNVLTEISVFMIIKTGVTFETDPGDEQIDPAIKLGDTIFTEGRMTHGNAPADCIAYLL